MSAATLDTPPSSSISPAANLPPSPPLSPTKRGKSAGHSGHSSLSSRPTLTAVDRLIGTLRLLRRGRFNTDSDWLVFYLTAAEYAEFEERLAREEELLGFFEDKVHYDWEPPEGKKELGTFVLRMPSALHELFNAGVQRAIEGGIRLLAEQLENNAQDAPEGGGGAGSVEDGNLVEELRRLYDGRSTTIQLKVPSNSTSLAGSHAPSQESASNGSNTSSSEHEERTVKRSPDGSFYHPFQPEYPTLVVEVSYSQRQKALPKLAESYIVESAHAVRAVVGFKLPYRSPATQAAVQAAVQGGVEKSKEAPEVDKSASYSLWRPSFVTREGKPSTLEDEESIGSCEEVKARRFRDSDGKLVDGALELQLRDLLPDGLDVLEKIPTMSNLAIRIDHKVIYDALTDAERIMYPSTAPEEMQEEVKKLAGKRKAHRPKGFLKRQRSPDEELSDGREEAFLLLEMREQQKEAVVDGEYTEFVETRAARRVRRKVEDPTEQAEGGASTAAHVNPEPTYSSRDAG